MIVPVAEKEGGFAAFFTSLLRSPFDKCQTVFIVQSAIGLETKMYVGKNDCFLK
jgi:hypothetical protein